MPPPNGSTILTGNRAVARSGAKKRTSTLFAGSSQLNSQTNSESLIIIMHEQDR